MLQKAIEQAIESLQDSIQLRDELTLPDIKRDLTNFINGKRTILRLMEAIQDTSEDTREKE